MTDKQTPPDWVLIEAAQRFGWIDYGAEAVRDIYLNRSRAHIRDGYRALCDMIYKYEQPPVDRKLLCVRKALETFWSDENRTVEGYCLRALELYEEGFGK